VVAEHDASLSGQFSFLKLFSKIKTASHDPPLSSSFAPADASPGTERQGDEDAR